MGYNDRRKELNMKAKYPRIVLWACLGIALIGLAARASSAENLSVSSPDGNVTLTFELKNNPQPYLPGERAYYRVSYKGSPVLADSPLGLDFIGARPLDMDFEIVGTDRKSNDTTWENLFGPKRVVPDKYSQLTVSLRERQAPARRIDLIFRAYDEGVALRYFLPKQDALEKFALAAENTGFVFARDTSAFILNMGRFNTHNEGEYLRTPLSDIKPSMIVNLPVVAEMPGGPWVALLEADLTDYAGMYVGGAPGMPNGLVTKLSMPPRRENLARNITTAERAANEQPVIGQTPKATPWRALMIAPTAGRLIETSYLILNLNPPCAIADTSWIKPGKAAWDWWSGSFAKNVPFQPGMNTATMLHYVDFAAVHRFEYMLIDAGWYPTGLEPAADNIRVWAPEVNIPEIIAHAKAKGVKILLWVEFRPLDSQLDDALALYEKWGVAGIKVDYMNRDDQDMVNLYEKWTRKAAEHHLTIDFHGAYKPTGGERTYPNNQTREAVMGMEYAKWSERVTPEYDVTLPFTRMLCGPMDFTPGAFRNAARGQFKILDIEPMSQGTRAHQLAMYVVFESPLVMLADHPEAYENQPGIEFIEKVPTVWDDTKVLNGEPGKFVTIVRKKGDAWYLGSMTNWDTRDFEISLDFLGKGRYEARIFADGPDAAKEGTSLSVSVKKVKAGDKLPVHLAPGGGLAVILTPVGR
jgi:alpha-glucosidase